MGISPDATVGGPHGEGRPPDPSWEAADWALAWWKLRFVDPLRLFSKRDPVGRLSSWPIMSQQDTENQTVRYQQKRDDHRGNEIGGTQLTCHQSSCIGHIERI
jgi:hypothetical protein